MMVPVIIFGCPGITAFAVAMVPAIIGFVRFVRVKLAGK
jgi:hypothetical protein